MNRIAIQEWAYETPDMRRYRERCELLLEIELVRTPACEPTLRALALDRAGLRARAHMMFCASCRTAAAELRIPRRGGLLAATLVAGLAIVATPHVLDAVRGDSGALRPQPARGGAAVVVAPAGTLPVVNATETGSG